MENSTTSYNIRYEILDYNSYYERLASIVNNSQNRFSVTRHEPIGQSKCGFDIEHFSIGTGPMHIVYMGGAHGNEIISVDYVTQLMENIALGNGDYETFDPSIFTLDFIPCQNPEGFFTTTYALNSVMKNMDEKEIESFSKKYWSLYREDDINVTSVNYILRSYCDEYPTSISKEEIVKIFWKFNCNKEITPKFISLFLEKFSSDSLETIISFIEEKWTEKFNDKKSIPSYKLHQEIFKGVNLECIPLIDERHVKLRKALEKIYSTGNFPIETLANFFANSSGVNLNDNNEYFYNDLKGRIEKEGNIYANLRDNNLLKTIPGPVGIPSEDLEKPFSYSEENEALFSFLAEQDKKSENYAFFNVHGTGGMLYLYPVFEDDTKKAHEEGVTRDFTFLINNRLATEYTKATGLEYEEKTGSYSPYKTMGYPDKITGVGDLLRKQYISSFLLELSKMGGNPLAPYGDRFGNFELTMTSNMRANMKLLKTILSLKHLYDSSYFMSYDTTGKVHYSEVPRKK